jgi:hypothetical protein
MGRTSTPSGVLRHSGYPGASARLAGLNGRWCLARASPFSSALTAPEVETLRQRLTQEVLSSTAVKLTRADFVGAAGVFLLVFLSTFPVVIPLLIVRQPRLALSLSNT